MIDMSISQLLNEVDKSYFTLYTEWQDAHFKVILLRSCMVPLSGEMYTENANYFSSHLDESFETYMGKTRRAFSGENAEIQFFLDDEKFTWKEQNILTRGEITVYPISNILMISDTLKQLLEYYKECQNQIIVLQEENKRLNETKTKLSADIEEMINIKNNMEKDLYTQFLLLLNSKKEKIRELQEALSNNEGAGKSKYDETTDESGSSDIEGGKIHDASHKSINTKKPKMDYKNKQRTTLKSSKRDFKRLIDSSSDESPVASTSKDKLILEDTDKHDMNFKHPDMVERTEESSEEDMFAP